MPTPALEAPDLLASVARRVLGALAGARGRRGGAAFADDRRARLGHEVGGGAHRGRGGAVGGGAAGAENASEDLTDHGSSFSEQANSYSLSITIYQKNTIVKYQKETLMIS